MSDDAKANKEVFHVNGFQVQLDENTWTFDMKKEQERSVRARVLPRTDQADAGGQGETAKGVTTVKALNEKLRGQHRNTGRRLRHGDRVIERRHPDGCLARSCSGSS